MSHASQEPNTILHYDWISSGFGGSRLLQRQAIQVELRSEGRSTSPACAADSCRRSTGAPHVPETNRGSGRGHAGGSAGGQSPDSEKVALGEKLFFDGRLSVDGTVACSTCHDPARAFTDGRPVSIGVKGRAGQRNAPTILNALYNNNAVLGWAC